MTVRLPQWAVVTPERREHIERVAALLADWADTMRVGAREAKRWQRAATLHDALKDAPLADQRAVITDPWGIDALVHGPAAAELAARDGEQDRGVLDAVRYHSIGYAGWDEVGCMLYLADYLEPGRPFANAHLTHLAGRVPVTPKEALCEIVGWRLVHLASRRLTPLPETLAFRDSLRCGD